MKSSHRFAFLCIILLAFNITAAAQHNSAGSIAVLPFSVNGVDPVSVQTAEFILRLEIGKISSATSTPMRSSSRLVMKSWIRQLIPPVIAQKTPKNPAS